MSMIIGIINAQSPILKITDSHFEQATFDNLNYFKQELKGVKVIGLGEASKYDQTNIRINCFSDIIEVIS